MKRCSQHLQNLSAQGIARQEEVRRWQCWMAIVVHNDNLFDIYLGESVAPYVTLSPLTAALPVDKPSMTLPLDHS